MNSTKFAGIWPLPGGATEQINTLKTILEKIREKSPTIEVLLSWFMDEYKLTGKSGPKSQLLYLVRFDLFREVNGKLSLSEQSDNFLKSGDKRVIYDVLNDKVLGFDDILNWLSSAPMTKEEVRVKFTEKYPELSWTTPTQPLVRLTWLQSFGYVQVQGRKYKITAEGASISKKETPPVVRPPVIVIDTDPLEKYLSYLTALASKHSSMSEADTISTLIEPLLEALNWNLRDPEEVRRCYAVKVGEKTEFVDIALKIKDEPVVLLEAKSVGTELRDYMAEQPIKYALNESVCWCVLTNGKEWRIYNAFWRVKGIEGKMFLMFSVHDFREKIEKIKLLTKESVASGKLDAEAESMYAERITIDWLKQKRVSMTKEIMQSDPSLKEECVKAALRKIIGE